MRTTLYFFVLVSLISCKNFENDKTVRDTVGKDGKVYHHDKTDMIIRDYDETNPLIIEAIELKNQEKPSEAIAKFNLAEKEYGKKLSIYLNRGICYDMLGNKKQAIVDFTKCLEIKSDYYAALQNRGLAYMNIGENDKSIADLDKAISINPSEPAGYLNRAIAYRSASRLQEACADAKKSIELGFVDKYNNHMPEDIVSEVCE